MKRPVFQIVVDSALRDRLQRLRTERHINVSAWARDRLNAALDQEFPSELRGDKRVKSGRRARERSAS